MTVIRVEHLSKEYRLGMIGGATLREDISRWWALKRGKDDPLARVGSGSGQQSRIGERFWALKDVSFEVKQGEILGIIGRNGAGKSTLLKILSRITAPSEGVVKIKGRIGSLLEVGTGFHPELTGRENIYLNGAILGMNRREVTAKLDEIIAFSEVEQFIDTPVKRYSSGMYVRLAFAVAAHLDPEILIVDEVLAVGDAAFQKKCLGKMGEVSREGRTVLFVSHNMASIQHLCTKVQIMSSGCVVYHGDTTQGSRLYLSSLANSARDVNAPEGVLYQSNEPDAVLTSVQLLDDQRRPVNRVMCGDPARINIKFSNLPVDNSRDVAIGLYDVMGRKVAHLSSALTGWCTPPHSVTGYIECRVNEMRLVPGEYSVNINVTTSGTQIYHHEAIGILSVDPSDIYGSGRLPQPGEGIVLLDYRWS